MSMIDPLGGTFEPIADTPVNPIAQSYDLDGLIKQLEQKAYGGDAAALEKLFNYRAELENREYNSKRADTVYERLVKDLQKAGISPYVLTGATPPSYSNATVSGGSQLTSAQTAKWNKTKGDVNSAFNIIGEVLRFAGTALMVAMMAA